MYIISKQACLNKMPKAYAQDKCLGLGNKLRLNKIRDSDSVSKISLLYTQACLESLSDSDKEAALYLAADKESLFIKKS